MMIMMMIKMLMAMIMRCDDDGDDNEVYVCTERAKVL